MLCTLPYLLCLCLFAAHSHIYATCASVTRDFPIVTLNLLQAQKGSCSHSCNASFIKRFFLIARSFSLVTSKHMIFFGISVCVASSVRRCCKRFYQIISCCISIAITKSSVRTYNRFRCLVEFHKLPSCAFQCGFLLSWQFADRKMVDLCLGLVVGLITISQPLVIKINGCGKVQSNEPTICTRDKLLGNLWRHCV